MTRNILIATVFSLATAVLLGIIFIGESRRMPSATAAITAERIERGARDYEQYCATCHGLAGQGNVNETAASPLNNIVFRYNQIQPDGRPLANQENGIVEKYGTLGNYIEATLYSGIRGRPMPAFGAQGTLRPDQIENITAYVLSMNVGAEEGNMPEAAIVSANLEATRTAPTADPNANPFDAGGEIFAARGCTGCHLMNDQVLVGPGLGGLFQPGGTAAYGELLPNGEPITEETVYDWIIKGTAGFPNRIEPQDGREYPPMPGFPNVTPEDYEQMLVWLRGHNRDGSLTEEAEALRAQGTGGEGGGEDGAPRPQQTPIPTGVPASPAAP
jgi:mono/diheme cytochrome c family protein